MYGTIWPDSNSPKVVWMERQRYDRRIVHSSNLHKSNYTLMHKFVGTWLAEAVRTLVGSPRVATEDNLKRLCAAVVLAAVQTLSVCCATKVWGGGGGGFSHPKMPLVYLSTLWA
jgi:hypothetical protein